MIKEHITLQNLQQVKEMIIQPTVYYIVFIEKKIFFSVAYVKINELHVAHT